MPNSDGISGAIKARLSSEILGTFSLSLMLCCWKIWIYVFCSETATWKIQKIDDFLYSTQLLQALFEAIIATLVILFAVPFLKTNYEIWLSKSTEKLRINDRKLAVTYVAQTRDFAKKIKGIQNLGNRISNTTKTLEEISVEISRITSEMLTESPFKQSLIRRAAMIMEQKEDMKKWISRLEDFEAAAAELGLKLDEIANEAEKES